MIKNTSYKVQVDVDTEEIRNAYKIEEGAFVTTESGVWTVYDGAWVKLYPQSGLGSGLGWTRYDDSVYTSSNKLSLTDGVTVNLPNNGATVYRSYTGIDYYNNSTGKVLADNENDVYIMTIVFKYQAPNANQTHLDLRFVGDGEIERINKVIPFYKGNDTIQNEHEIFQYYTDANFVQNGVEIRIQAHGGTAEIWDVIYFIQRTQNGSLS